MSEGDYLSESDEGEDSDPSSLPAGALMKVGNVFTPHSPVSEVDLFSGRLPQLQSVFEALTQRGLHAVLYGERGVGKTSLSNVVSASLANSHGVVVARRVNCDASDTFSSLWRKALSTWTQTRASEGVGFGAKPTQTAISLLSTLPEVVTPGDITRVLASFGPNSHVVFVFDEFDRLAAASDVSALMADTLKALSDFSARCSVLLIGVADSVSDLVQGHQSIERILVQVPMPRMSIAEVRGIVTAGLSRLEMSMESAECDHIAALSQGLPYITHLLCSLSARVALARGSMCIENGDTEAGIAKALEQWQQSIRVSYYNATKSPQPGNIYKEVLLACALADVDDLGNFTAAAVREPLRAMTGRDYDIPNFARHLKDFSEPGRGDLLSMTGESRHRRYRFVSPLIRPYIVMRGVKEGLIDRDAVSGLLSRISE